MALEVGIVGLPGAGKTTLFTALTKTGGAGCGKENVGKASIADDRLERLAELVGARKITPATIRVVDVPGTGPALLGGLRQVDAILAVADGFSDGGDAPVPDGFVAALARPVGDEFWHDGFVPDGLVPVLAWVPPDGFADGGDLPFGFVPVLFRAPDDQSATGG